MVGAGSEAGEAGEGQAVLVYLDNCCFNRPFDLQEQIKIRLETDAKLHIQAQISAGTLALCWSYMLDFENSQNPYEDRRSAIAMWKAKATSFCGSSEQVLKRGEELAGIGMAPKDALHVACAIVARCAYFITTDAKLSKKRVSELSIVNPVDFVRDVEVGR